MQVSTRSNLASGLTDGPAKVRSNERVIREAALRVWNHYGYSRATLKRIGEAAGLGEPALLRQFGSRAGIMRAALMHEAARLANECEISGDLHQDVSRLIEAFRSLMRRYGRLLLDFVLEASRSDEVLELVPIAMEPLGRAAGVIAYHQASGSLRGENPWEPLLALVGPLILPALQQDPQKRLYASASGNLDEFLLGWQVGSKGQS